MKKACRVMRTNAGSSLLAILVALASGCSTADTTGSVAGSSGTSSTSGSSGSAASTGSGGQTTGSAASGAGGASGSSISGGGSGSSTSGTAGSSGASTSGTPSADAAAPASDGSTSPFPQLPRVTTTDGPGPFTSVVKVMNTPPGGWMIYPTDIGKGGMKHPLFIFGPGGGTTPATYDQMGMHWDRYGSYGFVIYVLPASTGNGADMKNGLDWLISQNDDMTSPLYQHLDTSKVCAAGHSEGGITVFAFMPDPRVTTTVIISGGSSGGTGPAHLRNDTMFLCGPDGTADIAEPQCETDFAASTIPTFYTKVQGSTHITSGRLGWAATIAWMLWHLAGQEDQWKKEFLTTTGQFQTGIYVSEIKNWPP